MRRSTTSSSRLAHRLTSLVGCTGLLLSAQAVTQVQARAASTPASTGAHEGWTPTSQWVDNGDGSVTRTFYPDITFRPGAQGRWQVVDPTVVRQQDPAQWNVATVPGAVSPVRFGRGGSRLLELALPGGAVSLSSDTPVGAARVASPVVSYPTAEGGTVSFTSETSGVKEAITIPKPTAASVYRFHLADPAGVLGEAQPTPDGGFVFDRPAAAGLRLAITAPVAYELADPTRVVRDDNGKPLTSAHIEVTRNGDGFDVIESLDPQWLSHVDGAIVLDPSLKYVGAATVTDCAVTSAATGINTADCGSSLAQVGANATGTRRMLLRYDLSGFPSPAQVTAAGLTLTSTGTGSNVPLELHEAGASWTTGVTWLKTNGSTTWPVGTTGGDPLTTVLGSGSLAPGGSSVAFSSVGFTSLVAGWISGSNPNRGLVVKAASETAPGPGLVSVSTTEGAALARPALTVTYSAPPEAPGGVTATSGDMSMGLSWTAPVPNGSAITSYTITWFVGSTQVSQKSAAAADTSATITGLTNGTAYSATVTAINGIGMGAAGTSNTVVPAGVPFIPTGVTAARADHAATVSWTAPSANGSAITGYTVKAYAGSTLISTTPAGPGTSATVPSLTNGTAYTFTVTATNAVGTGSASNASATVTPAGVPTAPAAVTATPGLGNATVSWSAADANGDAITAHTIRAYAGGSVAGTATVGTGTQGTVSGLANGTSYTFTVSAENTVGAGAESSASSAITVGVPLTPSDLGATAGDQQATVHWAAPADNGVTVTSYLLGAYRGGAMQASSTATALSTSAVVAGLVNGNAYTFTVTARSSAGDGVESGQSAPSSPRGAPLAPATAAATAGDGDATLTWSAAADNGSAVTGYSISTYAGNTLVSQQTLGVVTTKTVTGLTDGTVYHFTVAGLNAVGTGTTTTTNTVTPAGVPFAPTDLIGTGGDHQVQLSWTAADPHGAAVSGYVVKTWRDGTLLSTTRVGAVTSATVAGLSNGTAYTFTVSATNAVGTGPVGTSNVLTPAGLPIQPTGVTASRGDQSAVIGWDAADGNGATITGYVVTAYTGTTLVSSETIGAVTTNTVTGLTNGVAYTFTVTAINAVGASQPSAATSPVTPAGVPFAPPSANAEPGDISATVSWEAADSNGDPVTGYVITAYDGTNPVATTNAGTVTSATVAGLTNGVAYTFRVAARNAVGSGPTTITQAVTPAGTPFAPTSVSALAGDGAATVAWAAANANGSPITGYRITALSGGTPVSTQDVAPGTSATYTGLTNGAAYTFTVTASNAVGAGASSSQSNSVTPAGTPLSISDVQASRGDQAATVWWTAAGSNGSPVNGNTLRAYVNGTVVRTWQLGPVTSATVTDLTNGVSYLFTVTATNAIGAGTESSTSNPVTPAGVPFAPSSVSASRGDHSAALSWVAPSSNGDALTGYTINAYDGSTLVSTTAGAATTAATVTGLTNGTAYTFTVAATNIVGTGTASAPSNALVPAGVPAAPTSATAARGNQSATVSWTAPDGNGDPVSGYTVLAYAGSTLISTTSSPSTSATVGALSNGTTYTFTVVATNGVGTSAESQASTPVTPAGTPLAPLAPSASRGDAQATVSWAAPGSNGSAITGYLVRAYAGTTLAATSSVGTALTTTVTGLTNGTTYTFTVAAINDVGQGAASTQSATVTPAGAPLAPTGIQASAGDAQVALAWGAANANGAAVTSYRIAIYTSPLHTQVGDPVTVTGTQTTVTGLGNGVAYTAEVAAANAVGTGPVGISATFTPVYRNDLPLALSTGVVSTLAGSGSGSTSTAGTGTAAAFATPRGVVVVSGFAYVGSNDVISKVNLATGQVTILAGHPGSTSCSDSNTSSAVYFNNTSDMATDGYYAYTTSNCGLRRTSLATGATSTVASAAGLGGWPPTSVTVAADGFGYVGYQASVKRVDLATGANTTVFTFPAGTAGANGVTTVSGVTADSTGLYVRYSYGDWTDPNYQCCVAWHQKIAKVTYDGSASSTFVEDSNLATTSIESAGDYLYVGTTLGVVRRYSKATGAWLNVAGSGSSNGYADGVGTDAWFPTSLYDIAGDGTSLFVLDGGNRLRQIAQAPAPLPSTPPASANTASPISTGVVSTLAGSGAGGTSTAGTGTGAVLASPRGVVVVSGFAYVGSNDVISKVNLASGQVTILAGHAGSGNSCTDSNTGSGVYFYGTSDLATDGYYLYSTSNCGLRRTSIATGATSTISTYVGGSAVTVGADGYIYVGANVGLDAVVRRVDLSTGTFTTVLNFPQGTAGANGAGRIGGLTSDSTGLYVNYLYGDWTDPNYHCCVVTYRKIVKVAYDGTTSSTLVTDPNLSLTPIESAGDYLYAGTSLGVVRRYSKATGAWLNIAGSGSSNGYADGVGTDAWFPTSFYDLAGDGTNLFVLDGGNRLRQVAQAPAPLPSSQPASANTATPISTGVISTVAGSGSGSTSTAGTGTGAALAAPRGVVVVSGFAYVANSDVISKVNLTSGQVTILAGHAGSPYSSCPDSNTGSAVYFYNTTDLATDGYYLYSSSGCGLRRTSIATGATSTISSALGGATSVTVGADGYLYVGINVGLDAAVKRVDQSNGAITTVFTIPAGTSGPNGGTASIGGFTSDSTGLYVNYSYGDWFDYPRSTYVVTYHKIAKFNYDGTGLTTLASDGSLLNTPIEAAGSFIYATEQLSGKTPRLVRFSKSNGSLGIIAGGSSGSGTLDDTGGYARFGSIADIASDGSRLYLGDSAGNKLRSVGQSTWALDGGQAMGVDPNADFQEDVNPGLGSFTTSATDASIAALGPALTVNRAYNSADPGDTGFGSGWTSNIGMGWQPDGAGNVVVLYPDGRRETHTLNTDASFSPPQGQASKLVADGNGGFTLTQTDGTVDALGSNRKLTSITDPNGSIQTYAYDGSGKLTTITSANGRSLSFTWNGSHVTSVATNPVNGSALTWTYSYADGLLTKVCDPRGTGADYCTQYEYTAGLMTKVTKPLGTTSATVGYNPDGSVQFREDGLGHYTFFTRADRQHVEVLDPGNNSKSETVDDQLRLTSETDADGGTQTYTYDARGFQDSQTDQSGNTTSSTFDASGNPLTTTDPNGHTAHSTYDSANNLLSSCDERSATLTDTTYCTTYTYDARRNKTSETQPGGATRHWTYSDGTQAAIGGGTVPIGLLLTESDFRGNVTQYNYTAAGDLAETISPLGQRTTDTYDALGRKVSETVYSDTFPAGVRTTWTYDGLGAVLTQTGPAVTNLVTGVTHQLRTTNGYDKNGNLISVTQSDLLGGDQSRTTTYGYDSLDRQVTSTDDQTGLSLTRSYDERGNVVSVTDQLGRVMTTTYDALNRPIAVTQRNVVDDPIAGSSPHDVVLQQTSYDAAGKVHSETDALGHVKVNTYDAAGQLTAVTLTNFVDPDGTTRSVVLERHVYNAAGQLADDYSGGDLRHVHSTYDAAGKLLTSTVDPGGLNRTTSYTYDVDGNVLTTTLSDGQRTETTTSTYGANNDVTSTTVSTGTTSLVTTATFDSRGVQTSSTDPRGNLAGADPAAFTTTTTTDELGHAVAVALPPVLVETNGGTPTTSRPTTYTGYDAFGDLTQTKDANGNVTTTAYDRLGRATSVSYPTYTTPAGTTLTPSESSTYDAVGNQTGHVDRRGQAFAYVFNSRNRMVAAYDPLLTGQLSAGVTRTSYDDLGQRLSTIDQDGATTRWTYDALGRVRTQTAVVRLTGGGTQDDTLSHAYDDQGNETWTRNPVGAVSTSTFDAAGERLTSTDADGGTTTFTYDVAGRQVSAIDPLGRSSTTTFDMAGRQVVQRRYDHTGALLTTQAFGYDAAGNQVSQTSARGFATSMTYDAANRLTTVVTPGDHGEGITTSAGYDAAGNSTRITDGRGNTTVHTFTSGNLLESTIEPATSAQPYQVDRTWTNTYDAGGLLVSEDQPGGVTITHTYDGLGRPLSESGAGPGVLSATRSFGYDLAGQRTTLSAPGGQDAFTYDDRGLLTHAAGPSGTASFEHDAAGRLTQRQDTTGTSTFSYTARGLLATATDPLTSTTRTYGYDKAGQPISVAITGPSGASSHRDFSYDDLGQLVSDQLVNATGSVTAGYAYGYDADGNILSKTITLPGNPAGGTHTYEYDQQGRLSSWTTPGGVSTTYAWDAAGNRTQAGTETYTYDERNRQLTGPDGTSVWSPDGNLLSTTNSSGQATTYTYDALSRLASSVNPLGLGSASTYDSLDRLITSSGTSLTYAGTSIKPVGDGTQQYARSIDDSLLAVSDSGVASLAGTDMHHDLTYLANPDGTATGSRVYDPFGTLEAAAGVITSTLGFQSDITDPTTGDVWMGARWYGPDQDTFLSQDSVTGQLDEPVSLDRYTYAADDPIRYFDADGHSKTDAGGSDVAPKESVADHRRQVLRILAIAKVDASVNNAESETSFWNDLGTSVTGTFDGVTFGLTKSARRHLGIDNSEMYSSSVYSQAKLGGTAAGLALSILDVPGAVVTAAKVAKALRNLPNAVRLVRAAGGLTAFTAKVVAAGKRIRQVGNPGVRTAFKTVWKKLRSARAAKAAADPSAKVWRSISATEREYSGSRLPRSFKLTTASGKRVWVSPNATKHMLERVAGSRNPDLGIQIQLQSLLNAVGKATHDGIPLNELIRVGGWELKFGPPKTGSLPALFHARQYGG